MNGTIRSVLIMLLIAAGHAQADVLHMGGNRDPVTGIWSGAASLELVTVGDKNNVADTPAHSGNPNGQGTVSYAYNIGKYEVTAGQYAAFLNAVAPTDPYGLYNTPMSNSSYGSGITQNGSPGSYTYTVAADCINRPVNRVSWGDAARFVNWLQNGQKTYAQDPLTTEFGSYTLGGYTDSAHLMAFTRNPGHLYYLPTESEWYKAAYYKGRGMNAGYWLYPTQSNNPPGRDMSEATNGGDNANYGGDPYPIDSGYAKTVVGEFQLSASAYGTFDQGGNVWEWNETAVTSSSRGRRGGSFDFDSNLLASSFRTLEDPSEESDNIGFRVVSIPEPSAVALLLAALLGGFLGWWRRRGRNY
jgi:formylglycine-generating enzyme